MGRVNESYSLSTLNIERYRQLLQEILDHNALFGVSIEVC